MTNEEITEFVKSSSEHLYKVKADGSTRSEITTMTNTWCRKALAIIDQLCKENERLTEELDNISKGYLENTDKVKKLQTELAKHRWIPVSERLPEKPKKNSIAIMVILENDRPDVVLIYNSYNVKKYFESQRHTHWKPIILPDKEE